MKSIKILFVGVLLLLISCKTTEIAEPNIFQPKSYIQGQFFGQNINATNGENGWYFGVFPRLIILANETEPSIIQYSATLVKAEMLNDKVQNVGTFWITLPSIPKKEQSFERFKELFKVGKKSFKTGSAITQMEGIYLSYTYTDTKDVSKTIVGYSSPGNQEGSSFEILASREVPTPPEEKAIGNTNTIEVVFVINAKFYFKDVLVGEAKNLKVQTQIHYQKI